jgi:5-formyltetrahydrofolate cyclo-ligase
MIAQASAATVPRSPDEPVAAAKEELRREARRVRDAIDRETGRRAAERAAGHLLALPAIAAARRVALFSAVGSELDAGPVARVLRARGVELAYPRVLAGVGLLEFHLVAGDDQLAPGAFGIPEPAAGAPLAPVGSIDVFVVPGLAFDAGGGRVGWGRGYYDRTLAAAPDRLRVGYCFDCQLVARVPRDRDDLPMHVIVTESGARVPTP